MGQLLDFHIYLLHPKLIHFPIALFMSAMGLEALSLVFNKDNLHRTALHIYILATLVAPLAVLTGLQEAQYLHLTHPVLTTHKTFALLTMWGSLASLPILWVLKKNIKMFRIVFLIFTLIIATFVTIAGHNGGRMVYEYGVGAEPAYR
jgi:uncharacterized membrane protein